MKPIFCGNFEYDAHQSDLERLFRKYGKVERVDMKSGFAFVYMDDERDAEDAIRGLDRTEFGRQGRPLRVEWTKQERGIRRPGGSSSRRSSAKLRPTKTLFVINFDPVHTRMKDLERHFDPYGKVLNVRIRRNFAFIQYESQEDATKALDATNMSKLMDQVISVEYAARDNDEKGNGYSPDRRGRDRSPSRRRDNLGRSPSPYRKERASPDYGRGSSPYSKPDPRGGSPYGKERASPDYGRGSSPYSKPDPRRGSPLGKERASPDYGRGSSPYSKPDPRGGRPYGKERASPGRGSSPYSKPDPRGGSHGKERASPDYGRGSSPYSKPDPRGGSHGKERASPDYGRGSSPYSRSDPRDPRDSPNHGRAESPVYEKYRSRSPPVRGSS